MRIVIDPETGEQYEVLDNDLIGAEPYDYGQYRRMTMTISREHRKAIKAAKEAGNAVGVATSNYHRELALTIPRMKVEHGSATLAEQLAKGEETVRQAKEQLIVAEANERAAMETVRMIRDDRSSALTMGAWSREANADGWRDQ